MASGFYVNKWGTMGGQVPVTTGRTFYVASSTYTLLGSTYTASDGHDGLDPRRAMATVTAAIAECTASVGDYIVILPGYTEDVAATDVTVNVAGVTIMGLGDGADRPTFTHTAVGSTFALDAASITLDNLLFTSSAAATILVDVNSTDATVKNCEFRMLTAVTAVDINGGSANACDRAKVLNCIFDASTDGPDTAIGLDEVADSVIIDGNYAYGLFDDACVHNVTGKVLTWLRITNNTLVNTTAASHSIELVSACTGLIAGNMCGSPLADATPTDIDGGATHMNENYSHDASGNTSGKLNPVVVT